MFGWARPQQMYPRQHWAPWKASCPLDSQWASDRPPGENKEGEEVVQGRGHRTRKMVVSSQCWWKGSVEPNRGRLATPLPPLHSGQVPLRLPMSLVLQPAHTHFWGPLGSWDQGCGVGVQGPPPYPFTPPTLVRKFQTKPKKPSCNSGSIITHHRTPQFSQAIR